MACFIVLCLLHREHGGTHSTETQVAEVEAAEATAAVPTLTRGSGNNATRQAARSGRD